jgi:hypothetical protein
VACVASGGVAAKVYGYAEVAVGRAALASRLQLRAVVKNRAGGDVRGNARAQSLARSRRLYRREVHQPRKEPKEDFMRRRMLYTVAVALFFLSLNHAPAYAQADETRKVELGGQFSLLNASNGRASVTTTVQCLVPPCPTVTTTSEGQKAEPGFGARIGYNFTENVALEAEGNFFPRERELGGGRRSQGLFGIKAGKRFEQVGLFVKARPGFVHFSEGDLQQRPDTACIAIFPPPIACFEAKGRTDFALDVGGVFEYYPSRRTIIRFDAGDTIIRMGEHRAPIVFQNAPGSNPPTRVVVGSAPSETTHNFQGSLGFGIRF